MSDNIDVGLTVTDKGSPTLKAFESTVIRTVGAVSASLATIAAIGFPIASAMEFQKNMLDVKKTTDLSYDSISQLGKGLIELSTHTNQSANDLAKMAEMGGRMGVADLGTTALIEFVRQVSILSTALNLSAEETATGMGKLINIFNLDMSQFQNAGAVINQLDNASTATATQLFDIMRRMGDLGGTVNLQQSAALSAVAIDLGQTAETAATTYVKIFSSMKSEASAFASFMGMSTAEWVKQVNSDGVQALKAFLTQLNKIPTEVAASTTIALVGGGRIASFVSKLQDQIKRGPTSILDKDLGVGDKAMADGTSAIKGQQSILSGLSAQWDVFKNKVNKVALAMGEKALVGLTKALIALGDELNKPENIAAFVKAMDSAIAIVKSLISAISFLTSGISFPWSDILQISVLMMGVKALGTLRTALLALPNKVLTNVGLTTPTPPKGSATTGAVKDTQEQTLLGSLRKSYTERIALQQKMNALKEADLIAEKALTAATDAHTSAQARLATAQNVKSMAAAGAAAVQNKPSAADAYLATREASQNQQRLALEQKYLADRALITGKGSVARKAALLEEYNAEVVALDKKLATQMRGYQRYYANLAAMEAASVARATAGVAQATTNTGVAANRVETTKLALVNASTTRMDTKAALDAAAAEIDRSSIKTKLAGIKQSFKEAFSGKDINGDPSKNPFSLIMQDMLGKSERFNSAASGMGKFAVMAGGAFNVLGAGVAAAGRALGVVVSVGLRLLGWVGIAIIVYDIGKAFMEMMGWIDPLIGKVNSLVDSFNKLTGLKIPKITTEAEGKAIEAKNRETLKAIDDAATAADGFGKAFGTVSLTVNAGEAYKQIEGVRAKLAELGTAVDKGVKINVFSNDDPTIAMTNAAQTLGLISKQQEYLTTLSGHEVGNHVKDGIALIAKEKRMAAIIAQQEELTAKQNQVNARPEYGTDTKAAEIARVEKLADLNEQMKALTVERVALGADIAESQAKETQRQVAINTLASEQNMLSQKSGDIMASLVSALPHGAWEQWFGSGNAADALIGKIQAAKQAAKEANDTLTAAKATASISANDTKSGKIDADKVSAAEAEARKATATYEGLLKAMMATEALVSTTSVAERPALVDALVGMGPIEKQIDNITKSLNNATSSLSLFQGKALKPLANSDTTKQLMGQLLMAQAAKPMYEQLASVAAASAEKAKSAMSNALAKTKQDMDALTEAAIASADRLRKNQDAAATTKQNRVVDNTTSRRLLDIDLEKQRELNMLEERGSRNAEEAAKDRWAIEEKFKVRSTAVTDDAADTNAKFAAQQQIKIYEERKAKAEELQGVLDSLAKKMKDPALSTEDKTDLGKKFHEATVEIERYLKGMSDAKIAIESLALSKTGNAPVDQTRLDTMAKDIATQTNKKNTTSQNVAGGALEQAAKYKGKVDELAASYQSLEKDALTSLKNIANGNEETLGKMAAELALLAESESFKKIAEGYQTVLSAMGTEPVSFGFNQADFDNKIAAARAAAVTAFAGIPAVLDTKALDESLKASVDRFHNLLLVPTVKADGTAAKGTEISATLVPSPDSKETIEKRIADMKLQGTIDLAGNVKVNGNAAGGLIGKHAAGGPIGRDITGGGKISGAGSGTSDSILFWGAHGEYMMDALTTRWFGPDFFAMLQSIAKSGSPASVLNDMMPKFAGGGALSKASFSMPSVLKSAGVEAAVTHLDLTLNGKKSGRVSGSRDAISSLVTALQEVARAV